jgi:hypothetical protein
VRAAMVLALAGAALWPCRALCAPLDELDRFVGTWQSQGTFVDGPYSKAGPATATTTCAWSNNHVFMICQQSVQMNGVNDDDLGIYTYDQAGSVYRFYNVHANRTTSTNVTVDGSTIAYPYSFTDKGANVTIRTLNVWANPNLYNWRTEYSTDGGKTWTLMASGASQKH